MPGIATDLECQQAPSVRLTLAGHPAASSEAQRLKTLTPSRTKLQPIPSRGQRGFLEHTRLGVNVLQAERTEVEQSYEDEMIWRCKDLSIPGPVSQVMGYCSSTGTDELP